MDAESASDRDADATDVADVGRGLLDEEMGPSSSMAHLYRGEIHRMTIWRERLDRTTNWAVLVMAAILTWAFSSPDNPHYILLAGMATVGIFLFIEARRYRGYDVFRSRVRTLQANLFAPGLDPSRELENPEWRRELARDYCHPKLTIPTEEAVAHRLRRVYLALVGVMLASWIIRVTAFATRPWPASAAIDRIPGPVVVAAVAAFVAVAVAIAFRPRTWHTTKNELRFERI